MQQSFYIVCENYDNYNERYILIDREDVKRKENIQLEICIHNKYTVMQHSANIIISTI